MFISYDFDLFSKKLIEIRKKKKLSRKKVSELSKVNIDTIKNIELRRTIPRFETLSALSNTYNINLIKLLDNFKDNKFLSDFYKDLDHYLSNNDMKILMDLSKLKDKLFENLNPSLVNNYELEQLNLYLDALFIINSDKNNKYITAKNKLIFALKVSHPNLSESKITKEDSFSFLELRIIYTLAFIEIKTRKGDIALEKLLFIYKSLMYRQNLLDNSSNPIEENTLSFVIKTLTLISHCYHIIDDYDKSLFYANIGITICNENEYSGNIQLLLFRKGVALKKLGDNTYANYMKLAVYSLISQGNKDLALQYIDKNKNYGISIDDYDSGLISFLKELSN